MSVSFILYYKPFVQPTIINDLSTLLTLPYDFRIGVKYKYQEINEALGYAVYDKLGS
jgi:hypothetical protein